MKAGTVGETGAFSLHPLKNLNVWGDGGVIVTNSSEINKSLKLLRNHGLSSRDSVEVLGCNSRLDSVQAVVGNYLVDKVHNITSQRIKNAERLDEGLKRIEGIKLPLRFQNRKLFIICISCLPNGVTNCMNIAKILVYLGKNTLSNAGLFAVSSIASGYKPGDFTVADRHAKNHDFLSCS